MKIRLVNDGEDYLILFLMAIGALIAVVGLYAGVSELIKWFSNLLSQFKIG
jgi:hypothetical protein